MSSCSGLRRAGRPLGAGAARSPCSVGAAASRERERASRVPARVLAAHQARKGLTQPCAPAERARRRPDFPSAVAHASPPRTGWYQGGFGGQQLCSGKGRGRAGSPSGWNWPTALVGDRTTRAWRSSKPWARWLQSRRGTDLVRSRRRSPANSGSRFGEGQRKTSVDGLERTKVSM